MSEELDKFGPADEQIRADAREPGGEPTAETPGYTSEAAFRHRNDDTAMDQEISPNQLAPGPIDERGEF